MTNIDQGNEDFSGRLAPSRQMCIQWLSLRSNSVVKRFRRECFQPITDHTSMTLDGENVLRRFSHTVWARDDLIRDYASLPVSILAERASAEVKVVFSGEGGDEVFAGYGRYRKTSLQRMLANLIAPGSGGFRTRGQLRRRWRQRLYQSRLAFASSAQRSPFVAAWQATPADWTDLQRAQYTDIATELPDDLLVKVDRMLMAFGIEGRVPFLDHRIVELGLSLPDDMKVKGRCGKVFLRGWAERYLPRDHIYRSKRGFHVPVGEWLKDTFLERLAAKLVANPAVREWFNPAGVNALLARHRSHQDKPGEIWSLLQFAIWHRLFVERPGIRPEPDEDPLEWIS